MSRNEEKDNKIYYGREYINDKGAVVVFEPSWRTLGDLDVTIIRFPENNELTLALEGKTITINYDSINLDNYKLVNPIMNKVKRIGGEPSGSNHEKKN